MSKTFKRRFALIALAVFLMPCFFFAWLLWTDWGPDKHRRLNEQLAMDMAARELIRVTRKTMVATDAEILGAPCMVLKNVSEKYKFYQFEFTRRILEPKVASVYVVSDEASVEFNVTATETRPADGKINSPDFVPNCGH